MGVGQVVLANRGTGVLMTDLDRKIAELKGFPIIHEKELMGTKFEFATNSDGKGLKSVGGEWWSQDISKAFELVDEVSGPRNDRLHHLGFAIYQLDRYHEEWGRKCWHWMAQFAYFDGEGRLKVCGVGPGLSAPEAICRAYIALKEREGKR